MTSPRAYFTKLDDGRYLPTEHAGGAWRDDELHLAPVAGLVVHEMERWRRANTDGSMSFSRFSFEVLGQIPREAMSLSTELVRPGRTIQLIETTLTCGSRVIIRARAWMLQNSDTRSVEGNDFDPMPPRDECAERSRVHEWPGGFIRSIVAQQQPGTRSGRGRVWVTSDIPLVEDEPSTPLAHFSRLLDTANGIVPREDPYEWLYPNVDLTLHLFRQPSGEFLGLDTRATIGPDGIGLTSSVVHDDEGPVGTLQQSLTVRRLAPRDPDDERTTPL